MPPLKKAEPIEGVVYMGSPVRAAHSSFPMEIATVEGKRFFEQQC